ncbi:hypothetical protein D9M69_555410 [compost metagenome]
MSSSRVHCTRTALPGNSLARMAASMMKSGLDLRPNPPPSRVTLNVTLSNGRPRRSPIRSRVTCGAWLGPQAWHAPSLNRAMATIGSIGDCDKCGK